jgi:hypothetical protein
VEEDVENETLPADVRFVHGTFRLRKDSGTPSR